jgi:hypothetical protein
MAREIGRLRRVGNGLLIAETLRCFSGNADSPIRFCEDLGDHVDAVAILALSAFLVFMIGFGTGYASRELASRRRGRVPQHARFR